MQKTIVISQRNLSRTTSGTPRKVHEEIRLLSELGHRVYAISEKINRDAVRQSGGIPVKTLRWPVNSYVRRLFYDRQVRRLARKIKSDLVIGHGDIINQDILFIHNCVHLAHEQVYGRPMDSRYPRGRIHKAILSARHFKMLVCNSHLMKRDLTSRFGIPDEMTTVLYPEYDDTIFRMEDHSEHRNRFREIHDIGESEFVVGLITSGDFKKRNVELLIRAVHTLSKRESFRILLVGEKNPAPAMALTRELGMEKNVIFAPCIDDVQMYYHGIDLFVIPALIEEFGRSVLEAMACGNPVIVSDRTGASEIMEGPSRDFILNDLTVESLAGLISELHSRPELRRELGEINRNTAAGYTASRQAERFSNIVEPFIAGSSG